MERASIAITVLLCVFLTGESLSQTFEIRLGEEQGGLHVVKVGSEKPVVTQNAKKGMRPYLHPITTPDGKGVLTEIHPSHHLHQTGVYWGLKKVNGRDFFMNHGDDYYRFKSLGIVEKSGKEVSWETVYDLIDENGKGILRETQRWTLKEEMGSFLLDLEWRGEGLTDVSVEKFFVGGLFLRMPWFKGISGTVINSVGEKGSSEAEGHRAVWVDI
ncbi:MAG: dehydrogenase, partial [Verrucomicrobia bacterium]|nr:dehydrogenase [Verrucomicrobiota bacterium]